MPFVFLSERDVIAAGCDVGSLTAKAVILDNDKLLASKIIRVRPTPEASAADVMAGALQEAGLTFDDIGFCCATGYGRHHIPFSGMNMSEISCHGLGAHRACPSVRTVIDIGGQDCKVIALDDSGLVINFVMNDKCAAGTGRSLEILSGTIGVSLEKLGPLSLKSWRPVSITNKCSIFMELEVLQWLYKRRRTADIAHGINEAVARRVASLAGTMEIRPPVAITGGVSKNVGVVKILEMILDVSFIRLGIDPQITGALGAAAYARAESGRRGQGAKKNGLP